MTPAASATREVSTKSGSVMTDAEKAAAKEAKEWEEFEARADAMLEDDRCFAESEVLKMLRTLDLFGLTEVLRLASKLKREKETESMRDYYASLMKRRRQECIYD